MKSTLWEFNEGENFHLFVGGKGSWCLTEMVAFGLGLAGRERFCLEGSPGWASVERSLLQLRQGRSESFGGMGKIYFSCDIEYMEYMAKAGQMS